MSTLREHQIHYRAHHRTVGCKITHLFGVPLIALSLPMFLLNRRIGVGMFSCGWALQFIGHFVFEKNRPMLFQDPKDPLTYLSALIFVTQEWLQLWRSGTCQSAIINEDSVRPTDTMLQNPPGRTRRKRHV